MPLMRVTTTPTTFDDSGREAFITALTDAACRAESLPDEPLARARVVVVWEPADDIRFGGHRADELIRAVFMTMMVCDGVLDPIRRERFAADVHTAALAAAPDGDARPTFIQVIFDEVPEGRWGRDGTIVRLPQMAAQAGFEHLRTIAAG